MHDSIQSNRHGLIPRPVPSLVACRIAAWVRALERGYNRHNIMSVVGSAQGDKS